ncbi:SAVMC3_10250 family protein [Saccharopolyspora shandongensis]|uniref:SAVMC3_10250 family protein n=1 Tax=Saccharopolyspora shandongensis TaxID=418495 RepID=UPI00340B550A
MRQLLYLSERKLRQFQPDRPRRWWRGIGSEVEAKLPPVGSVKLTRSGQTDGEIVDLVRAIAEIEESDLPVRWFDDQDLHAGEWVRFEARLNYATHAVEDEPFVVFFWEPATVDGRPRLLLHGSRDSLVGVPRVEERLWPMGSDPLGLAHFVKAMAAEQDGFSVTDDWGSAVGLLYGLCAATLPPATAAPFRGLARVTAVVDCGHQPTVIASPLYVEYSTARE